MQAKLIGESAAGMTAVEIYNDEGVLVWARQWFTDGCSSSGYVEGLRDVVDCMRNCANVRRFEGGEVDDNGDPVRMDVEETTGVMAVYDSRSGWALGDDARGLGEQSSEIVDALMVAGLVPTDSEHEDRLGSEVMASIQQTINDGAEEN